MSPAVYRVDFASPLDLVPPADPSTRSDAAPWPAKSRLDRERSLPRSSWKRAEALEKLYEESARASTREWDHELEKRSAVEGLEGLSVAGGGAAGVATLGRRSTLEPNSTQSVTLGVIGAYVVVIAILWNVPYVEKILWPWKILTVAFHEFSHAAAGICTGARVKSISLDPNEGGCTMMSGGVGWVTLPAGYLGSSLIGAALIFAGFDIVASKVASIVVGVVFLLTLWFGRKDWLTIATVVFATGVMVAFWFIAHGAAIRFYILFVGVMSSLYSVFDICDDLIFRKVNESDASVFAKRYGGSSQCWGVVWVVFSLALAACGIIAGLAAFKQTFSEQAQQGKDFLPTRFMF
ncbi:hypothetical protein JCM10212_005260 [Sporobolomyces blumeae]